MLVTIAALRLQSRACRPPAPTPAPSPEEKAEQDFPGFAHAPSSEKFARAIGDAIVTPVDVAFSDAIEAGPLNLGADKFRECCGQRNPRFAKNMRVIAARQDPGRAHFISSAGLN